MSTDQLLKELRKEAVQKGFFPSKVSVSTFSCSKVHIKRKLKRNASSSIWHAPLSVNVRPGFSRASTAPSLNFNREHRSRSSISLASLSFITALPFIDSDKTPNSASSAPASPVSRLPFAHSLSYTSSASSPLDSEESLTTLDESGGSRPPSVQKDSSFGGQDGIQRTKQGSYMNQQADRNMEGECIQTEMGEYWIASREDDHPLGRKEVGAIQSFGVLLVLKEEANGAFRVIMVSEVSMNTLASLLSGFNHLIHPSEFEGNSFPVAPISLLLSILHLLSYSKLFRRSSRCTG